MKNDPQVAQLRAAIEAARKAPARAEAWDEVEQLAGALQKPEEVEALYREVLGGKLDAPIKTAVGLRALRFHDEWFGGEDSPALLELLGLVLEASPAEETALSRVSMLLTVGSRWDELLAVYDRAIAATTDPLRHQRLLEEALQVARDFAKEPEHAISYLSALLAVRPGDAALADALEKLLQKNGRFRQLVELLQARAASRPPAEALATRERIAAIWLDELEDPTEALSEIERFVGGAGDDAGARALLRRIVDDGDVEAETRRRAADLLRARLARAGREADVLEVLGATLAFSSPAAQLDIRRELGARLPAVGQADAAMDHLATVLRATPGDAGTRLSLRALAGGGDAWARYRDALLAAADAADGETALALVAEAAEVSARELGDAPRAIELFARVLGDGDVPDELALGAARRQSALLDAAGRRGELCDVLERQAALEPLPVVQKDLLQRAARLSDELGDTTRAVRIWRSLAERDAGDVGVREALADIFVRDKRWADLRAVLGERQRVAVARGDGRADAVRIARLEAAELDDAAAAIRTWQQVAEAHGEDAELVDALAPLHAREERWEELGGLLERAEERESRHLAGVLVDLADARRERLGQPLLAVAAYGRVLAAEPRNQAARAGLTTLTNVPETRAAAVDVLARAYLAAEEWAALLALLDVRLATRETDAAKVSVLREAAELSEKRVGDAPGALRALARALPLAPRDALLEDDLVRIAEQTGAWKVAAAALHAAALAAERAGFGPRAADLYRAEGTVQETRAAEPAAALSAYLESLRLAPDVSSSAVSLVRVAARAGRWEHAARAVVASAAARGYADETCLADIEAVADASKPSGAAWDEVARAMEEALSARQDLSDRAGFMLEARIAGWHDDKRGEVEAAEAAWVRALAREPESAVAQRALVSTRRRLFVASPDAASAQALFDALLVVSARRARDLAPLREAAEVALGARSLGGPQGRAAGKAREVAGPSAQALPVLHRLFEAASRLFRAGESADGEASAEETATWATERLVELLLLADDHPGAIDALVDAARMPLPVEARRALRHRAAALALEMCEASSRNLDHLADSRRAVDLYRDLLAEQPEDAVARAALLGVYEREDRLPELYALRRDELVRAAPGEARLALRLVVARISGDIEERGGRIQVLRQNLEEAPGHEASVNELIAVLQKKGQASLLADLLTEQARRVEGIPGTPRAPAQAARAATIWAQVAVFAERDLEDVERAIDAHRRVVALAPNPQALDALARLYGSRADHASAARWLEKRLESATAEERVTVALRLARAHVAARQPGRAITWLERTLPRNPEANEVRSMLADLYRDADAWAPLAKLLCDGCRYAADQTALLAMVREAASLYHERLATPERAVPLLEQARELVPDDRWVRLTLADGLRVVGRYAEARKLLEGVIADYGRRRSPERADVHLELARVLRADGKLSEALAQLDLAAGMKVGDLAVMATLGAVAREALQLDRAEQAYRALLLVVRRAQGDPDPSAIGPSEVLFALSRIAVGQGNTAQAEELRQQALAAAAADSVEARRFSRAAQAEGEAEIGVRALDQRRAAETHPAARAALDAALGELYEDALDKPEEALAADLRALEGLAPDRALHARARALAKRLDQPDRYLGRLEELAERHRRAEEAPLVSELLLRLGEALEEDAGDLARAAETFARVEALGHHPVEAKKALARVAGMRGVSGDERRRLEEIVALADAPEDAKVDALYRLADIDVAGPENRARGIAALEDALERDPQYARASASLRDAADGAPDDADLWALFERVARVSGDDGLLADYLERRARHPAVTLDELREAVTLTAQRGEAPRERALLERTVDRARELPGGLGEALWAAEALAERRHAAGDDTGAIRWLREAAGVADPTAAEALTVRAAQLAASDEATMDLAVELYRELCERRPAERSFWEPLLDILRRRGDAESAGALVAAVAGAEPDVAARNVLRIGHARWLVETADGKRDPRRVEAASLLREVLDAEPENAEVIAVLGDLYQQSGDSDALLDLLRRQIEAARRRRDAPALVALSLRAAEVLRTERPDDARALLREAAEWAPSDRTLLSRLLELLRGEADGRERAERMEQLLAVERGTAAAKLARDLADTWDKLGDEGGVRRALEVGYHAAPADEELRRRLERFYRERKDWSALAALLVSEAARREKAPDAVALFREAATLHREHLSDPAGAASALRSALALAPADVALVRELIAVHEASGDAGAAAQDIQAALRGLPKGDPRALELHKMRAELLEEVGREADAVADFERAFSLGGVAEAPRLVAALQRWRDRAGRGGDLAAERAATMRLVEVLLAAKDEDGARDALVGWIAADPTDREALRALRGMDESAGRWGEVAESCQRLVALSRGAERIDAAVRLAEACVRAGDPAAARAGLEQAWAADPNPTLRQELKKLYEQIGAHREHAEMLLAEAEATESDAARYPLLIAAGQLLLDDAEEPAEALGPLRAALAIKADDPEANILLVDACVAGGLLEEAAKRLEASIAAMGRRRTPELAVMQQRMARVAESYGDARRQRDWLIAAIETDRNNGDAAADLADLSMKLGDHDTALKALRVVTLLKTPCRMTRAMAFLRQAQIAHQQGDGQKALVFARRARAEDAQLAEAGDFLRQLGDA